MTGALVILAAMVVIGVLLFITDVAYFRPHHSPAPAESSESQPLLSDAASGRLQNPTQEEICCGMHLVCEKTSLAVNSDEIIYYDDEELDRFAGRNPESYSFEETEEFRDVLMTLLPEDVAGWARSISLRRIELPSDVKDELFILVNEYRGSEI